MFESLKQTISGYKLVFNTEEYFVLYQNETVQVTEEYYLILKSVQEAHCEKKCLEILCQKYPDLDAATFYEVSDVILEKLRTVFAERQSSYTYLNLRLVKLDRFLPYIKKLNFLFTPIYFFTWFFIVIALCVGAIFAYEYVPNVQLVDTAYYVLVALILIFVHELGHVIAASRISDKVASIYFGMYLFMPIFYTDVSHVWSGRKIDRIVATMAGYGLQLLPTAIFLVLSAIYHNEFLYNVGVLSFVTSMWGLLFPFGRSDGYWLLVDISGRKNLMRDFYKHIALGQIKSLDRVTLLYGIVNFAFLGYMLFRALRYILSNDITLFTNIRNLTLSYNDIVLIIICIFFVRILHRILKWVLGFAMRSMVKPKV